MTALGRHQRGTPLPDRFQGAWVDKDSPEWRLHVDGDTVTCGGVDSGHDYFDVEEVEGALLVNFGIDDQSVSAQDGYHRERLTNLVFTPEGQLHGYNVKWSSTFEKQS